MHHVSLHSWSIPRSTVWGMYYPLTGRGNYYLGRIILSTTVIQLVGSCANIQTWQSSNRVCILQHNIIFLISKRVKSNGEINTLGALFSFYIQHAIKIDNHIEYQTRSPRTPSRSLRAIVFYHQCIFNHREVPYLESTDKVTVYVHVPIPQWWQMLGFKTKYLLSSLFKKKKISLKTKEGSISHQVHLSLFVPLGLCFLNT